MPTDEEVMQLRRELDAQMESDKPLPIRTPEEIRQRTIKLNDEARKRQIERCGIEWMPDGTHKPYFGKRWQSNEKMTNMLKNTWHKTNVNL